MSGSASPTLAVLTRAAAALQVSIEELIGSRRTACRLYAASEVPERRRQGERWELGHGDALVFRGDQRHSYRNPDRRRTATAISVVCFALAGGFASNGFGEHSPGGSGLTGARAGRPW